MLRFLLAVGFLALCLSGSAQAADLKFPPLTGRVVDQTGLLTQDQAQDLDAILAAHEAKGGQQVVVAIVSSLEGHEIEDYGYRLGRAWGIGQKGTNTGAILLVAPNERRVRIEVGYGLEGTLTDAKCSDIVNEIVLPAFKAGKMGEGVVAGTRAILTVLGDDGTAAGSAPLPQQTDAANASGPGLGIPPIAAIIIFFVIMSLMLSRRRSSFGLGLLGGMMSNSWSSGSSGGGGSGFSGGGGSFGGGGASGSW